MKVALIGDSHAEGLGLHIGQALREQGHELVYLDDRRGWSTQRMLDANMIAQAAAADPDIILISSGHNDRGDVERYIIEAGRQLKATGTRVGWIVGGPSTRPDVEARHRANRSLIYKHLPKSWIIDGRAVVGVDDLAPDGVHLLRSGYQKWATAIAGSVSTIGRMGGWVWLAVAAVAGGVGWYWWRKR